jgi:glycosyltransferase involved in cell wall biosynthesis
MSLLRKPTILQVLPSLDTGGVERGTLEMVQAIVGAGGSALVASAGGRMVNQVERAGGRHVQMALMTKDPLNIYFNAGRLARLMRRESIDLVHARSRAPAWSAWIAARRQRVAFVTTWHGIYGEEFWGKHRYNSVMARGERVITASRYIAERVKDGYGVDADRLRLIPRGVDTDVFDPQSIGGDRVHRLAEAWRVPTGAPVVMLPARVTRWKGAEALLQAARVLGRPDVFWVLVGSDQGREDYAQGLTKLAKKLGVLGQLRLAGHCEDMPAALLLADVVVNASAKPEPFGRNVIEAQAMARPVVAFHHGGAAETVAEGLTGFLVPPGDVPALAAAIGRALDLPDEERAWLGWRAREAVLAGYTTAAMQEATLEVYREVLWSRFGTSSPFFQGAPAQADYSHAAL